MLAALSVVGTLGTAYLAGDVPVSQRRDTELKPPKVWVRIPPGAPGNCHTRVRKMWAVHPPRNARTSTAASTSPAAPSLRSPDALSLPYPTVWHWCRRSGRADDSGGTASRCFRCRPDVDVPTDPAAYALSARPLPGRRASRHVSARVPVLRIACTRQLAGPDRSVRRPPCERCSPRRVQRVQQAGLRQRAELRQALAVPAPAARPWQEARTPDRLDRLAATDHRDGTPGRLPAWPVPLRRLPVRQPGHRARGRTYIYPRYMFVNELADIMRLCQWGARPARHRLADEPPQLAVGGAPGGGRRPGPARRPEVVTGRRRGRPARCVHGMPVRGALESDEACSWAASGRSR